MRLKPPCAVTPATGLALVAGGGGVVEIIAARPLEQIAARRRLVAQLARRARQQGAAQHFVICDDARVGGKVAVRHQRTDPQPAVVGRPRSRFRSSRLMSTSLAGVSTCNFIRSSRLVPPAMNFTPSPASATAASALSARVVVEGLHASATSADGVDDVGIGRTAAEVAAHPLGNFLVAELRVGQVAGHMARPALADLVQHPDRRTDLPGRAIAALIAVMLHERRLERVQVADLTQTLRSS